MSQQKVSSLVVSCSCRGAPESFGAGGLVGAVPVTSTCGFRTRRAEPQERGRPDPAGAVVDHPQQPPHAALPPHVDRARKRRVTGARLADLHEQHLALRRSTTLWASAAPPRRVGPLATGVDEPVGDLDAGRLVHRRRPTTLASGER